MFITLFVTFLLLMLFIGIAAFIIDRIDRLLKSIFREDTQHERSLDNSGASPTPFITSKKLDRASLINLGSRKDTVMSQADAAENTVELALRQLKEGRYFVFRDLIIPSASKSMTLTQIDHVVVSTKGIFCIETKSNNGNLYGFSRSESWKQYLGNSGKPYSFNSPYRQNAHHVSSLKMLLEGKLKAPVHSYIAFPNAKKVVVDSVVEDMSPAGIVSKIERHQKDVYKHSDVESIAKILAHAGTLRDQLRDRHIDDVRAYLDAKVADGLRLS